MKTPELRSPAPHSVAEKNGRAFSWTVSRGKPYTPKCRVDDKHRRFSYGRK